MKAWVIQLCLTLCTPMHCSPPGSSVQRILQARILEWVAIPSSRESSRPRDRTCVSYISCATTDTTWEAQGKWKLMMLNTVFIYLSAIWVSGYLSGKTPAKVCVCFFKMCYRSFFFLIHRLFRIYIISNTFPTLYLAFETCLMVFFNEQKFWVSKILFISIFLCC